MHQRAEGKGMHHTCAVQWVPGAARAPLHPLPPRQPRVRTFMQRPFCNVYPFLQAVHSRRLRMSHLAHAGARHLPQLPEALPVV